MRVTSTLDLSGVGSAVVISTYYNLDDPDSHFRYDLTKKTLLQFAGINAQTGDDFPVIIVDTSPDHAYMKKVFGAYRGVTVLDGRDNPGIGPQNMTGVQFAYDHGAKCAFRMEGEKRGLTAPDVIHALAYTLHAGYYDIYCVGRQPEAFATLPPYQQVTERLISRTVATLGLPGGPTLPEDTASGIRGFNRRGMKEFLEGFDPDSGGKQWEFMWFVPINGLLSGLKVGAVWMPFKHPKEMTEYETAPERVAAYNAKRDDQLTLIVPKVVTYAANRGFVPTWDPQRKWEILSSSSLSPQLRVISAPSRGLAVVYAPISRPV